MSTEICSAGESFVIKFLNRTFGGGPAVDVLKVNGLAANGPLGQIQMNAAPAINGVIQGTSTGLLTTVITGNASPSSIVVTGAKVGDIVVSVTDLSTPADDSTDFEKTISVSGHIARTSGSATDKYLVLINRQS